MFVVCVGLCESMLDHCVVLLWLCSAVVCLHQFKPLYFTHAWANSGATLILSAGHGFQRADCNDYRACDMMCLRLRLPQKDTFIEEFCFT